MTRPLRRPGYPWPGQFGLGPQSVDEIVRRLNQRPSGPPPRRHLGIRWVRPLTGAEFQTLKDNSIAGPSEENYQDILQAQRLSDDEVNAYSPSMWVRWVESDTEADDQASYSIDYNDDAFKVYFPMFAWARDTNAAAQANHMRLLRRHLMSKGEKGRFPVAFNPKTGNWECISLTEAMPTHIWAKPTTAIAAAVTEGGITTFGSGGAKYWVNKQITPTVQNEDMAAPDNLINVYNWTGEILKQDQPYYFWLDVESGKYMVGCCGSGGGEIAHVQICDPDALPDCCLYSAAKMTYSPIGGTFCDVEAQQEPIWARCANGYSGSLPPGYCKIGHKIHEGISCELPDGTFSTRPVYQFDCGACVACVCPDPCETVTATIYTVPDGSCNGVLDGITFDLACVDDNPILDDGVATPGFWGGFKVEGLIARTVYSAEGTWTLGETTFTNQPVYVELSCGCESGDAGAILAFYDEYLDPIGVSVTLNTGIFGCEILRDDEGEPLYRACTYSYGLFVNCDEESTMTSPQLYWLKDEDLREPGDMVTVTPACSSECPKNSDLPAVGLQWGYREFGETALCCQNKQVFRLANVGLSCSQDLSDVDIIGVPPAPPEGQTTCPECIPGSFHFFGGCPCATITAAGGAGDTDCDVDSTPCDAIGVYLRLEWSAGYEAGGAP